jgi:hypothetical protein
MLLPPELCPPTKSRVSIENPQRDERNDEVLRVSGYCDNNFAMQQRCQKKTVTGLPIRKPVVNSSRYKSRIANCSEDFHSKQENRIIPTVNQ